MRIHARRAILLALGWLPAAAAAQQVFKCVAGDEVAYQSAPCAAGQATEKAWEHGHSDGLSSVANWYDDLSDLL